MDAYSELIVFLYVGMNLFWIVDFFKKLKCCKLMCLSLLCIFVFLLSTSTLKYTNFR